MELRRALGLAEFQAPDLERVRLLDHDPVPVPLVVLDLVRVQSEGGDLLLGNLITFWIFDLPQERDAPAHFPQIDLEAARSQVAPVVQPPISCGVKGRDQELSPQRALEKGSQIDQD